MTINFYEKKNKNIPRLIYRNFYNEILKENLNEEEILTKFTFLIEKSTGADFTRFVWNLPKYFKNIINSKLEKKLQDILNSKKNKNNKIKKLIFPIVSDEFSLSNSFLLKVFNIEQFPNLKSNENFFTMGSCFASNFSKYLISKNIKSINFAMTEDLNSPGSNASLLQSLTLKKDELKNYLDFNLKIFFKNEDQKKIKKVIDEKINELNSLYKYLNHTDVVIITLGNAIDYYLDLNGEHKLLPKFLSYSNCDINKKNSSNQRMRNANGNLQISNLISIKKYIYEIYRSLLQINNKLKIIFTLSPIPIDNVVNIKNRINFSAIEVDCISKSYLRACFNEFFVDKNIILEKKCYYLPMFEIVRWIAPQLDLPLFGNEDASSRHVSNEILNAACDFAYFNCFK